MRPSRELSSGMAGTGQVLPRRMSDVCEIYYGLGTVGELGWWLVMVLYLNGRSRSTWTFHEDEFVGKDLAVPCGERPL